MKNNTTILIQLPTTHGVSTRLVTTPCALCDGNGLDPQFHNRPCRSCGGRGAHRTKVLTLPDRTEITAVA